MVGERYGGCKRDDEHVPRSEKAFKNNYLSYIQLQFVYKMQFVYRYCYCSLFFIFVPRCNLFTDVYCII